MNAWLMKGYFDTVPMSLDESAKLDGAGHFRRFWQIVLPLVRPMIAVQGPAPLIEELVFVIRTFFCHKFEKLI